VTGGGRRLGRRVALALARDGYDVAITFHGSVQGAQDVVAQLRGLGARAAALQADLRDVAQLRGVIQRAERELGPIELLVNNAAVFTDGDAHSSNLSGFDEAIALNLRAPYALGLDCARAMRARGRGAIVNIASVGGLLPYARHIPYSVSKAGLVMLTRALAVAFAPEVRVNAVAPGTIWIPGEEEGAATKPPAESIPLQSFGTAEDVEQAVLYLARAPFITGEILVVDGGVSLRSPHP
jgi:NAD(P)-dependent dehydrogenase (short-subunit alcohol dehydrogenase family)